MSPSIPWTCFKCGDPNFSPTFFAPKPVESIALPSSLLDLSHTTSTYIAHTEESSAHTPASQRKTLGHPPFASSLTDPKPLRHSSIAGSVSEISILSDPMLKRPKSRTRTQSLRVLAINFQSAKPKKEGTLICLNQTLSLAQRPDSTLQSPTTKSFLRHLMSTAATVRAEAVKLWSQRKKSLITHQLPIHPSAETVLVSIQTNTSSSSLTVVSLYRAPSATSDQETAALLDAFDRACRSKKDVWLGGDLNLPDIDWNTNSTVGHQYPKSMN